MCSNRSKVSGGSTHLHVTRFVNERRALLPKFLPTLCFDVDDRETKGSSIVAAIFASTLACSQKRRKLNDQIVLMNRKDVLLGIEEKYSDVALTFLFYERSDLDACQHGIFDTLAVTVIV